MFTLEKNIITAARKTITIREPVSPEARMIAPGTRISPMMRANSLGVFMGLSCLASSWASMRIMASLMNSEGWMV